MAKLIQDPRYSNAPIVLPRTWQGSRTSVTSAEQLKGINLRDIGLDPVAVSRQPQNKMLRKMLKA
jgi:hypothetical protein